MSETVNCSGHNCNCTLCSTVLQRLQPLCFYFKECQAFKGNAAGHTLQSVTSRSQGGPGRGSVSDVNALGMYWPAFAARVRAASASGDG